MADVAEDTETKDPMIIAEAHGTNGIIINTIGILITMHQHVMIPITMRQHVTMMITQILPGMSD